MAELSAAESVVDVYDTQLVMSMAGGTTSLLTSTGEQRS